MQFCQAFNAQTQEQSGTIIPVEITVYEDKSFTFVCKTPPAAVLIKEKLGLKPLRHPAAEDRGHADPRSAP